MYIACVGVNNDATLLCYTGGVYSFCEQAQPTFVDANRTETASRITI